MTLIELLVVISIIGILSTIGLATYINFNRTQILVQTTRRLVQDLRLAESLAVNNQKPVSCMNDPLEYYAFVVTAEHSYKITYKCGGNEADLKPTPETISSQVTISPSPWSASFKVISRGVIFSGGDSANRLTISGFDKTKTIIISKAGDINLNE